jgi:hypothetical protein
MPLVAFEPTTAVFERTKTVHALDCEATVVGDLYVMYANLPISEHSHEPYNSHNPMASSKLYHAHR